ncbi:MAG TPA: hypothetical protein VE029_12735 [Rhizobacter sp.]|nr:hypothetical protein [Rhizobacter sp.]
MKLKELSSRRMLGVVAVLLASQLLSACVIVPVPRYRRAVIVEPAYGSPPPHRDYHDPRWDGRRGW